MSSSLQEKRIKNRVYRQCARDGFNARLKAELAGDIPQKPRLYSYHLTRQSYFNKGWYAVTQMHIAKARYRQQAPQRSPQ